MLSINIESEDPTQITLLINGKRYQYASTESINSKFKWLLSKNKGRALAYLRKEAILLNNKDYDPNFHIELPEGEMKKENVIEIKEELQVPGTDIILEEGDKIKVVKEAKLHYGVAEELVSMLMHARDLIQENPESMAFTVFSAIDDLVSDDPEFYSTFVKKLEDYLGNISWR